MSDRDLDARVAVDIFGCKWRRSSNTGRRCLYGPTVRIPKWMAAIADGTEPIVTDVSDGMVNVPAYSGEMSDAWLVVQAMMRHAHKYEFVLSHDKTGWLAEFTPTPRGGLRIGRICSHTAPTAICESALDALGKWEAEA